MAHSTTDRDLVWLAETVQAMAWTCPDPFAFDGAQVADIILDNDPEIPEAYRALLTSMADVALEWMRDAHAEMVAEESVRALPAVVCS